VELLLKYYNKLDEEVQELIPLKRVWIPRETALMRVHIG